MSYGLFHEIYVLHTYILKLYYIFENSNQANFEAGMDEDVKFFKM